MAPPMQPANGVLPVPATVLRKKETKDAPQGSRKSAGPRLKVSIRRLPPGMTKNEFDTTLGTEWRQGAGKVNWVAYENGKISKDFSKPSRPARAYLHLTDQKHLKPLSEKVQQCNFVDAKNTSRDPALIGPPALEFSPYTRVPMGRKKNDPRQGTIDQDSEFIQFLESLTNPVLKPSLDSEPTAKKLDITTTPLIEHIREKKAAKERAGAKAGKHAKVEAKDPKTADKTAKKVGKAATVETQEKGKRAAKTEKPAKESVKVLNKEAATTNTTSTGKTPSNTATNTAATSVERPIRAVSVAARIQQDLGLNPGGRRSKKESGADSAKAAPAIENPPTAPAVSTASPKKTARPRTKKKGDTVPETTKTVSSAPAQPTILKKSTEAPKLAPSSSDTERIQAAAPNGPKTQSSKAETLPTNTSRQAFLKHANPSQGITEVLIEEALKAFGGIEKVEIDRKKGFAYVDFADHEGLKKAIAASPITVAQGAVQVLEKRDKSGARAAPVAPRGTFRGGRADGRTRGGGRVGGNTSRAASTSSTTPAASSSTPAPIAPTGGPVT